MVFLFIQYLSDRGGKGLCVWYFGLGAEPLFGGERLFEEIRYTYVFFF